MTCDRDIVIDLLMTAAADINALIDSVVALSTCLRPECASYIVCWSTYSVLV